jgi:HAMP domain-containing protein
MKKIVELGDMSTFMNIKPVVPYKTTFGTPDLECQLEHVKEEMAEVEAAYKEFLADGTDRSKAHLTEECVDLMTVAATFLKAFAERDVIRDTIEMVNLKNSTRGYFDHEPPKKEKVPAKQTARINENGKAENDEVNHPAHYQTPGGIECIEMIRSTLGKDGYCAYLRGNIIKYTVRYPQKGGIKSLEKAAWYLTELIKTEKA